MTIDTPCNQICYNGAAEDLQRCCGGLVHQTMETLEVFLGDKMIACVWMVHVWAIEAFESQHVDLCQPNGEFEPLIIWTW